MSHVKDIEEFNYLDLLSDNSPKVLKEYEKKSSILNKMINKKGVNNIAITSKYGSGKSSLIKTYKNNYRPSDENSIEISLLSITGTDKTDDTSIERSIIQQILFSKNTKNLPESTLKKTEKTNGWILLIKSVLLTLIPFLIFFITLSLSNKLSINSMILSYILIAILFINILIVVCIFIKPKSIRKISYKDFEINFNELEEKDHNVSLINRFMDELIYFIKENGINLLIFEDLDRFESVNIFIKLRELNTILNSSIKSDSGIKFIYAVKNDLFKNEEERSKFFDFIIQMNPIIHPIKTSEIIREKFAYIHKKEVGMSLTDRYIKLISGYIKDMRVLNNTFNDYIVLYDKLNNESTHLQNPQNEKIFSMALFKNLFPEEYSQLEENEGTIPKILNLTKIQKFYLKDINKELNKYENQIDQIKGETLNNFEELKLMFIGQVLDLNTIYNSFNTKVEIKSIETFENLEINKLIHPLRPSYGISFPENKIPPSPNGVSYIEREKNILSKEKSMLTDLQKSVKELVKKQQDVSELKFSKIVRKINLSEYIEKTRGTDEFNENVSKFIRFLIVNDYIDVDYLSYTANYRSNIISLHDQEAIMMIQRGESINNNNNLNMIEIINRLDDEDFQGDNILSNVFFAEINNIKLISNKEQSNKYNNLINTIKIKNKKTVDKFIEFTVITPIEELKILEEIYNISYLIDGLIISDRVADSVKSLLINIVLKNFDENLEEETILNLKEYMYSLKDISEVILSVPEKNIQNFFTKSNFKLKDIDCFISNNLKTFIIEKNHYEITLNNITYILTEKNEEIKPNMIYKMISNYEVLYNYIEIRAEDFVENVLLDSRIDKIDESQENMIKILNMTNKINYKEKIITKFVHHFDKLDEEGLDIEDITILFENNKVEINEKNSLYLYENIDKKKLFSNNKLIANYDVFNILISKELIIKNDLILDCLKFGEDQNIDFFLNLKIDFSLAELSVHFQEINSEKMYSNLTILIQNGYAIYQNSDLPIIFNDFIDFTDVYIGKYHEEIKRDINIVIDILKELKELSDDKINTILNVLLNEYKEDRDVISNLFNLFYEEIIGENLDFSLELRMNNDDIDISEETLIGLVELSRNYTEKLKLINYYLKSKNNILTEKMIDIIYDLSEEWSLLLNEGENNNFNKDEDSIRLLKYLEERNFLTYKTLKTKIKVKILEGEV